MKIHLPNSAFLGNINNFLSFFDSSQEDTLEITANDKWIYAHPMILAMIAALGKKVGPEHITCEPIVAASGHYLSRMGLFKFMEIEDPVIKEIEEHEPAGRMIPLRSIKNQDDLNNFLKDLVPLLHLETEPQHVEAIQHIFTELIRNVFEHATAKDGAIVCAQYFKKSNKIGIGIADTGVGLRESIGISYPVQSDFHAMKLALTPGVTGTTRRPGGSADNGGFGLFLIKSIALINGDFFNIISGDVMYKLLKRKGSNKTNHIKLNSDPTKDRHSEVSISSWPGVAVGVDISLSATEEFDTLLQYIYKFYNRSSKEKRKRKFKKPKFV